MKRLPRRGHQIAVRVLRPIVATPDPAAAATRRTLGALLTGRTGEGDRVSSANEPNNGVSVSPGALLPVVAVPAVVA